eukprot:jgi/Hompol1/6887/HPOL_005112-RA
MLCYFLQENLPDFKVTMHIQSDANWASFVEERFREFGWDSRWARDRRVRRASELQQLVWVESGELIGK